MLFVGFRFDYFDNLDEYVLKPIFVVKQLY